MWNRNELIRRIGILLLALLLILPLTGVSAEEEAYFYYNEWGGKYYHSEPECASVAEQYWPLKAFSADELNTPAFNRLLPCPTCVLAKTWETVGEGWALYPFPTPTPRPTAAPGEIDEAEAIRLFREAMVEEFGEERAEQLEVIVDYYPASEYYDSFYHLEAMIPESEEERAEREAAMSQNAFFFPISDSYAKPTGFAQNLDAKTGLEYHSVLHKQ